MMLPKMICVLLMSAMTLAAAPAFDASQTAADLATKIKPQLPAGWSISVEKNTITVTRQKPVEWYGTISLPYHESKADLKRRGFVQSSTYTITVEFGPPMTTEQVAKLDKENDKIVQDYEREHPINPRSKSNGTPKELREKLHHIPNVLTKDFSAVVTPFIQGWMAFYSEEDEKECRGVEQGIRTVLSGKSTAAPDPIDRLVARLASNPVWQNGRSPAINLPADASAEQVVSEVFKMTGFDPGRVTKHRIVKVKRVEIQRSPYTAALVETDLGEKVVLFGFAGGRLGWWSRVFDVEAPAALDSQAANPALHIRIAVPEQGEAKVRMRAIFEQKAEKGVDAWAGRVASPEEEITFRSNRQQR